MSDDQHGEGTPRSGGRWDPLPQGDYDDGDARYKVIRRLARPISTIRLVPERERGQDQPSSGQEDDETCHHSAYVFARE